MKNKVELDLDILNVTKKKLAKSKSISYKTNIRNFDTNYGKLREWSEKFYFFWNLFDIINNKRFALYASSFFNKNKDKMEIPKVMLEIVEPKRKEMLLRCHFN